MNKKIWNFDDDDNVVCRDGKIKINHVSTIHMCAWKIHHTKFNDSIQ